ncbi:thiol-activated cytolysin family protein [Bacteroides sp. AN502(2024)]|uniref:thiol-activated cytolysin family protein n=1 Tax=Bacteroides sp. AN502(2024) TaxID=3160599 RepID=UPI003512AC71
MKKVFLSKGCFLLLFSLAVYACSKEETVEEEGKSEARSFSTEINMYVSQLPSVQQMAPFSERRAANSRAVSTPFAHNIPETRATASLKEFYEQAKEFEEQLLFSDDRSVFYPGALLQAQSVIDGDYTSIIADRQPIVISTDLQGKGDPTVTVSSPSLSNVRKGINELLGREFNPPAANLTYSIEEVHDKAHLKLAMGGNYKGAFNTVESSAGFSFDREKNRFLVKVQQVFYELSVDEPQNAASFFAKEFDYKKEFGNEKPLYVSSVKYGRILLLGIETNMTKKEAEAKLQASVLSGKVGLNAEAAYSDLLKESTIRGRVLGGNSQLGAIASIDLEHVKKFVEEGAKFDAANPGAPIAYKLKELGTNRTFKTVIYSKYTKHDPYAGEFTQMSFDLVIPDNLKTLSGKKVDTGRGYIQVGLNEENKNEFFFYYGEAKYTIPSYKSQEQIFIVFDDSGVSGRKCIFELPMFEMLARKYKATPGVAKIFDKDKDPLKLRDRSGNFVIDLGLENLKLTK